MKFSVKKDFNIQFSNIHVVIFDSRYHKVTISYLEDHNFMNNGRKCYNKSQLWSVVM